MDIDIGFGNLSSVEEIFENYQKDPLSVEPSWRTFFDQLDGGESKEGIIPQQDLALPQKSAPLNHNHRSLENSLTSQKLQISPQSQSTTPGTDERIFKLIQAYRDYGHFLADTNPIQVKKTETPKELTIEFIGFSEEDLEKTFLTCGFLEKPQATLSEILEALKKVYCGKIGVELKGIRPFKIKEWLQEKIESTRFSIELSMDDKKMILESLNKSELFESFIHTKFVGQKRFSLEGGESLIPMLESIIYTGSQEGVEEVVIGMAHRGRLNVLANILEKSYSEIFSEFEEGYISESVDGGGDVKYHKGFSSDIKTKNGKVVKVSVTPNPSHLEAVAPVVQGQVRAKQIRKHDDHQRKCIIPVILHGDAAVSGQGVVYETMQMYALPGYSTGGTIHIVINNQIGFTTLPKDSRSTHYCTDLAHAFGFPVFHVNGEDPEACTYAMNLALKIRQKFHCDVFIDLICYRKYGHNEGDEPAFTQPLQYQLIRKKITVREIYRDSLIKQGVLEKQMAEDLEKEFKSSLQEELKEGRALNQETKKRQNLLEEEKSTEVAVEKNPFEVIDTGCSLDKIKTISSRFCSVPEGFSIHRKLLKTVQDRTRMLDEASDKKVDWGMAETLAFGTLLWEGTHVRLSGQDSRRGTFGHRHVMWIDQKTASKYFPLSQLKPDQGRFDVFNSLLSEFAVLGFEFGYSMAYKNALVIWEAQFGDFCNSAQVIIDQFISTAEQKWSRVVPLVLLLPHGYEGQGPEHSSARLERFLSLCGKRNMFVCNPTTPVQLFHLLRRQVSLSSPKPLIMLSPKSLLRHPECLSSIVDFTKGSFQEIIDDIGELEEVKKIVLCNGKIYYDLIAKRREKGVKDMAIIRVEQLYPFHFKRFQDILEKYQGFSECTWVQEEPRNMGAWQYIRSLVQVCLPESMKLKLVSRRPNASPAVGSFAAHKKEHEELMEMLFGS